MFETGVLARTHRVLRGFGKLERLPQNGEQKKQPCFAGKTRFAGKMHGDFCCFLIDFSIEVLLIIKINYKKFYIKSIGIFSGLKNN